MGNKIMVNPANLESASQKILEQASDYEAVYKNLFDEVEGMASVWQGKDNVAFTNQIKGFMDDFQKMTQLMREYAEFLKQSATSYRKTQQEITDKAKTLSN